MANWRYDVPSIQETAGSDPLVEPNPSGAIAIAYVTLTSYTPLGASWPVASFSITIKLLGFQASTIPHSRMGEWGTRGDQARM
jgi:hypothetical protein